MSYILDALKKSERERTLVRGVGFGDAGRQLPRDRSARLWLMGGVVVAAVVIAGGAYLWHERATQITPAELRHTSVANSAPQTRTAIAATPLQEAAVQSTPKPAPLLPAVGEAKLLSAMPAEFQQRVPPMIVNIHVYAQDESQRILYINNRQFSQGDEIPGGVVVEEIVPDGVVLQYEGQRFRLPRPS